jgi:hypothetical protein
MTHAPARTTYPPLNTLKAVARDIWIVDGPAIQFGLPGLKMAFPTRMTLVRLAGGGLFVHSPTPLTPALKAEVEREGTVRWIAGPNRIHYWWIPDWTAGFPQAAVYLAPRIQEQAKGRISGPALPLDRAGGYPWDAEMATLPVAGRYMTEAVFFHRPSRSLMLTDFIENFEPEKLGSFLSRWLTKLGGVRDPNGSMPRDMRLSYARDTVRAAVEIMFAWNPERIILAHGRWYERDGVAELRRAFRWVLD